MTDREVVTEYREILIEYSCNRENLLWNLNHGFPLMNIPDKLRELKELIFRFEDIMDNIPDWRTRNVLRGRYALGLSLRDISFSMGISVATAQRICDAGLSMIN